MLGETARQNATEAALISAEQDTGIEDYLREIDEKIGLDPVSRERFRLPLGEGGPLNLLHERAAVFSAGIP